MVAALRKATFEDLHAGVQKIRNGSASNYEDMQKIQKRIDAYITKGGWTRLEYHLAHLMWIEAGLGNPVNAKSWAEDDK